MSIAEKDVMVKVSGLTKSFLVPHEKVDSLKGRATQLFRRVPTEKYVALDDITFDVKKGEFFGIVGRNGSGKSTLLKILAGVYQPTKGKVAVDGRMATFIELGVGFNFELSGRDNVFLNGAILGMSRKEIESKFDEIVEFAELEEFIDQKIKNYSSGMQVRLAFAVAIQAEADIILIDEVLAVGDFNFQQKCFDIFRRLKADGKTIVFVTHDMNTVTDFCDRVLLIDSSRIRNIGSASKIANDYLILNNDKIEKQIAKEDEAKKNDSQQRRYIEKVRLFDNDLRQRHVFTTGSDITIEIILKPSEDIKNIGVAIFREDELYCFGTNTIIDDTGGKIGEKVSLHIKNNPLLTGRYHLKIGCFGERDSDIREFVDNIAPFRIQSDSDYHGAVNLRHSWEI